MIACPGGSVVWHSQCSTTLLLPLPLPPGLVIALFGRGGAKDHRRGGARSILYFISCCRDGHGRDMTCDTVGQTGRQARHIRWRHSFHPVVVDHNGVLCPGYLKFIIGEIIITICPSFLAVLLQSVVLCSPWG